MSDSTWEALLMACDDVIEMLGADVGAIERDEPIAETSLAEFMPRRFLLKYDLAFAERLKKTAENLVKKLDRGRAEGWGHPLEGLLNSVAEEMLFSWMIRFAIGGADSAEEAEELEGLQDMTFEDRDFEWLYDLSYDGVTDDPEISQMAGFANLAFKEWFKPFR